MKIEFLVYRERRKMDRKVLIVASTASMIKQFNMRNIGILAQLNYRIYVAANFKNPGTITREIANKLKEQLIDMGVVIVQVNFQRGIGDLRSNIRCFQVLRQVMSENSFEFIHVHTALAGVIARVAGVFQHQKILYTIHGMQFVKGGSLFRWLMFFPVEFAMSFVTNTIITINEEDSRIVNRYFNNVESVEVPGVGINFSRFDKILDKKQALEKYGYGEQDVILLSIGELSARKNHMAIISALKEFNNKNIKYLVVGIGALQDEIEEYIQRNNMTDQVKLLGYCESKDLVELIGSSDYGVFPSTLEGLMTAGLEVMAAGIPLIFSDVRGIRDYSEHNITGYNIGNADRKSILQSLEWAVNTKNTDSYNNMSKRCRSVAQKYDKSVVDSLMTEVYERSSSNKLKE